MDEEGPVPPMRVASSKNDYPQGGSKPLPIAPMQDDSKKKKGFNKIFTSAGIAFFSSRHGYQFLYCKEQF